MEVLNVGLRRYAASLVFWTAFAASAAAMGVAFVGVGRVAAAILIGVSLLFKLWIQWQNDHGGFVAAHSNHARWTPAETLSPVRWLVLIALMLAELMVLLLVLL